MKQLSIEELRSIVGGQEAIALMVANANVNGADWTDEQWDEWARKFEAACSR